GHTPAGAPLRAKPRPRKPRRHGFLAWGWRIPFILSLVLLAVGLYIRLGIVETPPFARLLEQRRIVRQPVAEVIQKNWREIILAALVRMSEQAPFYICTAFVLRV